MDWLEPRLLLSAELSGTVEVTQRHLSGPLVGPLQVQVVCNADPPPGFESYSIHFVGATAADMAGSFEGKFTGPLNQVFLDSGEGLVMTPTLDMAVWLSAANRALDTHLLVSSDDLVSAVAPYEDGPGASSLLGGDGLDDMMALGIYGDARRLDLPFAQIVIPAGQSARMIGHVGSADGVGYAVDIDIPLLGNSFDVEYDVTNSGDQDAGAFFVELYLSDNDGPLNLGSDQFLERIAVGGVAAGNTFTGTAQGLSLPDLSASHVKLRIDADAQVPEANEGDNAAAAAVVAADLNLSGVTFPTGTHLRGEAIAVSGAIGNDGLLAVAGGIDVTVEARLSLDLVWGNADDIILGTTTSTDGVALGGSRAWGIAGAIPADAPEASYYRALRVSGPADLDPADNTWFSAAADLLTADEIEVQFTGRRIEFRDFSGDVFTISGRYVTGSIFFDFQGADPDRMEFTVAAGKRGSLTISRKRGTTGLTPVGNVTVTGSLTSLSAKTLDLRGDLTVTGSLGRLTLGDVTACTGISIGLRGAGDTRTSLSATLGKVAELSLESLTPIRSLKLVRWLDAAGEADYVEAPSLGSLKVTGDRRNGVRGDFQADLRLSGDGVAAGRNVLGSVSITGYAEDASFAIGGNVGTMTVGALDTVDILVGCTALTRSQDDFNPPGPVELNDFTLKSLTLKGIVTDQATGAADYLIGSSIGVWRLRAIRFRKPAATASGLIEYGTLGRATNKYTGLGLDWVGFVPVV